MLIAGVLGSTPRVRSISDGKSRAREFEALLRRQIEAQQLEALPVHVVVTMPDIVKLMEKR